MGNVNDRYMKCDESAKLQRKRDMTDWYNHCVRAVNTMVNLLGKKFEDGVDIPNQHTVLVGGVECAAYVALSQGEHFSIYITVEKDVVYRSHWGGGVDTVITLREVNDLEEYEWEPRPINGKSQGRSQSHIDGWQYNSEVQSLYSELLVSLPRSFGIVIDPSWKRYPY